MYNTRVVIKKSFILMMTLSILLVFEKPIIVNPIAASSPITNNGVYFIKNKRTGKYLTASSASSGASLYMGCFSGSSLQKFKIQSIESNDGYLYYSILLNSNLSLRLDVCNASDSNGTTIGLFINNPSYSQAQRFRFLQTNHSYGQDTYRIMPKLSSTKVVSVSTQLVSGNGILLYDNNSSNHYQDWYLELASMESEICGNINIYKQETNTTCGIACVRNLLSNLNIIRTEGALKNHAVGIADGTGSDYTFVWVLTQTINDYLNDGSRYSYVFSHNYSVDGYLFVLAVENDYDFPVILNGNFSSNGYVPYNSTGHYVLCSGIKSIQDTSIHTAIISDSYNVNSTCYAGIWEMPLSELRSTNRNHSSGGYIIAAEIDII